MPQRSDCWNCKQIGHAGSNCPKIQCYKCGNIGHISPACTRSKRLSNEPGPSGAIPEHVKMERSREPSRPPPMVSPGKLKYFAPNRHNDDPKIYVTTGDEHQVEGSGSEARGSHQLTSVGVLTYTSQTPLACSLPSTGSGFTSEVKEPLPAPREAKLMPTDNGVCAKVSMAPAPGEKAHDTTSCGEEKLRLIAEKNRSVASCSGLPHPGSPLSVGDPEAGRVVLAAVSDKDGQCPHATIKQVHHASPPRLGPWLQEKRGRAMVKGQLRSPQLLLAPHQSHRRPP